MPSDVAEKIRWLCEDVRKAAAEAGRDPSAVEILLVTKTLPVERLREAYDAGWRMFGENRVQEYRNKREHLPRDIQWHLIGRLQTNKVKHGIKGTPLIQSLDRVELAAEIQKQGARYGMSKIPCLIQINSSGEAQKGGVPPEEASGFVRALSDYSRIEVRGLMTVGPLTDDKARIRQSFRITRELRDSLQREFTDRDFGMLSMGMSGDYRLAVQEGSTLIRVGSLVFGARPRT